MRKLLAEIYDLQNKLNIYTIKLDNWFEGVSSEGMNIDWLRYAKLETNELVESFPVKHWKDIDKYIDLLNAWIELCDILHFLMSQLIRQDLLNSKNKEESIDLIATIFEKNINDKSLSILDKTRLDISTAFFKNVNKWDYVLAREHLNETADMSVLFEHFCLLCNNLDLSFEELYKLYIGKNCLNQFRQDNGYKEGTYKKVWNGKEDNVVMKELLSSKKHNFETLYYELNKYYLSSVA